MFLSIGSSGATRTEDRPSNGRARRLVAGAIIHEWLVKTEGTRKCDRGSA